jgi:uncharacterized membrane protein YedE/YeeE
MKKNKREGTLELVLGFVFGIAAVLQGAIGCGVGACAVGAGLLTICPVCAAAAGILVSLGLYKRQKKKE